MSEDFPSKFCASIFCCSAVFSFEPAWVSQRSTHPTGSLLPAEGRPHRDQEVAPTRRHWSLIT